MVSAVKFVHETEGSEIHRISPHAITRKTYGKLQGSKWSREKWLPPLYQYTPFNQTIQPKTYDDKLKLSAKGKVIHKMGAVCMIIYP